MAQMKADWDGQSKGEPKKKPYDQPSLKIYGSVKSLTAGGPTGPTEQNPGQPPGSCNSNPSLNKAGCSDRSAKENIVHIGTHALGIGLYLFDYKPKYRQTWGCGRQFGVMADEVEKVMPAAVCMHPDGYKMVYYAMLGISHDLR
jgi:hypothetical protein